MLHIRDAQSYPLHGVDIVHERPKPKYPLRDLVKLWQEAKQREEEADRRAEHWHHAYNIPKQDYLALRSFHWNRTYTEIFVKLCLLIVYIIGT